MSHHQVVALNQRAQRPVGGDGGEYLWMTPMINALGIATSCPPRDRLGLTVIDRLF